MAIDTNGKILLTDFFNLSSGEKDMQATIFSEGSQELKEILLFLWNNGVETLGCCVGHSDDKSGAYIAINVENIPNDILANMLIQLSREGSGVQQLTFTKGGKLHYQSYDERNRICEETKNKPAVLNILCSEKFESNRVLDILKTSFNNEKVVDNDSLTDKDVEWIKDILFTKDLDLNKLNFSKYVKSFNYAHALNNINGKVSKISINRDSNNIEYSDDYEFFIDDETDRNILHAVTRINAMSEILPTGSITEEAKKRLDFYKKMTEYLENLNDNNETSK